MFKATTNGRSLTWDDGTVVGDSDLVAAVTAAAYTQALVAFNFWGARPASLSSEFDAYITIGSVLQELAEGVPPVIEPIPDNPEGYMPEGPTEDDSLIAAAYRHLEG